MYTDSVICVHRGCLRLETDDADPYFFIVIFVWRCAGLSARAAGAGLDCGGVFFSRRSRACRKTPPTNAASKSIGEAQVQFQSQYYLYCIIFLIFDVEAIFLVPFAVAFTGLPVGAFIAMLVFLLLLIEGLVWAWSKGCLDWAAR